MKIYKYEEWDFIWKDDENTSGGFDDRLYVDLSGNLITGILEGFYYFPNTQGISDEKNCQYVENGIRKNKIK